MPSGRWQVRVTVDGRPRSLESYASPEDAARRYDQLAKKEFGEFAALNFPDEA